MRQLVGILASLFLCLCTLHAHARSILVLGDSLSAAYGISINQGWVNLLQQQLNTTHPCYQIKNASQSGMTTQQGKSQLSDLLKTYQPNILILALGANDGLRGQSLATMRKNLSDMIALAKQQGGQVLLIGMHLPPNYGKAYTTKFHQIFVDTAKEAQVSLLPFLLADFGTDRSYFQADGLHPNAHAQSSIMKHVFKALKPLLTHCQPI